MLEPEWGEQLYEVLFWVGAFGIHGQQAYDQLPLAMFKKLEKWKKSCDEMKKTFPFIKGHSAENCEVWVRLHILLKWNLNHKHKFEKQKQKHTFGEKQVLFFRHTEKKLES